MINSLRAFTTLSLTFLLLASCNKNPTGTVNNEDEERILFLRGGNGISEICTMKPDGSDVKVINRYNYSDDNIPQDYMRARWSPDKSNIVVEGGPGSTLEYSPIWIMSNDGNLLYKLTWNGGMAVWSPDGENIIFSRRKGYFSLINDLYIINSSGENERILYQTEDRSRYATDWSKDGTNILITETYTYIDSLGRLNDDSPEIGILDMETKEIEYLTENEVQDYLPKWSPDGTKIVFVSGIYKNADLFVYDLKDKTIRNLTENPDSYQNPIWSPDGQYLAYSKPNQEEEWNPYVDIYIIDIQTKSVKK